MLYAIAIFLLAFSFLTCMFALVKGGTAERIGSAIILGNLFATMANEYLLRSQLVALSIDGLTALLLLAIAVRYASIWLGAVMLLYGLQFALHASYIVLERPRDNLHVVLNNADWFAVSICLAVGTVLAWMGRRRVLQTALRDQAA